jgi:hypothetical protein
MRKLPFVAIFVAVLLLAVATVSTAETIHGCYNNRNGALRIVNEGTSCGKSETAISWNNPQPTGGITGTVLCKTNPITGYTEERYGVIVFAFSHSYMAVTNWDGKFTLSNMPDGTYDIATIIDGFQPFELGSTRVTVAGGAVVDIGSIYTFKPDVCYDPYSEP